MEFSCSCVLITNPSMDPQFLKIRYPSTRTSTRKTQNSMSTPNMRARSSVHSATPPASPNSQTNCPRMGYSSRCGFLTPATSYSRALSVLCSCEVKSSAGWHSMIEHLRACRFTDQLHQRSFIRREQGFALILRS